MRWYRKSRYGLAVEQWEEVDIVTARSRHIHSKKEGPFRKLSYVTASLPPSHAARMPNGLIFHAGGTEGGRHRGLRRSLLQMALFGNTTMWLGCSLPNCEPEVM